MLNFAQLKFLLTGLTLLTVLAACSDDNTSTEAPPATIEIAELSPEADNVSFIITLECFYKCLIQKA